MPSMPARVIRDQPRRWRSARVVALAPIAFAAALVPLETYGQSTTSYCVTPVDATGTAPVVTRPDWWGYVSHALPPGFCGIRITGECMGTWCWVSSRGGQGWIQMRFVSMDRR